MHKTTAHDVEDLGGIRPYYEEENETKDSSYACVNILLHDVIVPPLVTAHNLSIMP